jgi:hypothetical protein
MLDRLFDLTCTRFSIKDGVVAPRKFWPRVQHGNPLPIQMLLEVHGPNWDPHHYTSFALAQLGTAVRANRAAAAAAAEGNPAGYAAIWAQYLHVKMAQAGAGAGAGAAGAAMAAFAPPPEATEPDGASTTFGPYPAILVPGQNTFGGLLRIRNIKHHGQLKVAQSTPHVLVLREKVRVRAACVCVCGLRAAVCVRQRRDLRAVCPTPCMLLPAHRADHRHASVTHARPARTLAHESQIGADAIKLHIKLTKASHVFPSKKSSSAARLMGSLSSGGSQCEAMTPTGWEVAAQVRLVVAGGGGADWLRACVVLSAVNAHPDCAVRPAAVPLAVGSPCLCQLLLNTPPALRHTHTHTHTEQGPVHAPAVPLGRHGHRSNRRRRLRGQQQGGQQAAKGARARRGRRGRRGGGERHGRRRPGGRRARQPRARRLCGVFGNAHVCCGGGGGRWGPGGGGG